MFSNRKRYCASTLALFLFSSTVTAAGKPPRIEIGVPAAPTDNELWNKSSATVLSAENGFTARHQTRSVLTSEGTNQMVQRVVYESPWGESAEMTAVVKDGAMAIAFGDLTLTIAKDEFKRTTSISVDDGYETAVDIVTAERLLKGPNPSLSAAELRPYELIAAEVLKHNSEEFLEGLLEGFKSNSLAPVGDWGDCAGEALSCGVALVGYGLSVASLALCFVPGVGTLACVGLVVGHEIAAGTAIYSCVNWIHCDPNHEC